MASGSVRVVATASGFDGVVLRSPGEEFDLPASVFDKRPKKDEKGVPIPGQFYDPPSWFKLKVEKSAKADAKPESVDDLT